MWSDGYNLAAVSPALQAGIWKGTCKCTASTDFFAQASILQLSALPPKFSSQKALEPYNGFITRKVMGNFFMPLALYQIFTVNNNVYILCYMRICCKR